MLFLKIYLGISLVIFIFLFATIGTLGVRFTGARPITTTFEKAACIAYTFILCLVPILRLLLFFLFLDRDKVKEAIKQKYPNVYFNN